MKANRFWYLGISVMLFALVSGCASVPMSSIEDDTKAKAFTAPAGKSNIYVYRNESFGGGIPITLSLDGKVAGQTGPKTYFMWEVEPGTREIASIAENTSTLKLNAEAGKSYYVWQEVKMGMWMARSLLQEVDAETGKSGVAECKRAQSNF